MDATDLLGDIRLMPVVELADPDTAVPLAQALLSAGINAIEVTLRTPQALTAIQNISTAVPQMLVGAGSVRQPEQFAQIQQAGAQFAVSPGATTTLLDGADMPYIPGAATASECLHLLQRGYQLQKFFPAESLGGAGTIKALAAPIQEVRFCPTGGINAALLEQYFAVPAVACVGGSWFVPADLVAAA